MYLDMPDVQSCVVARLSLFDSLCESRNFLILLQLHNHADCCVYVKLSTL